MKRITIKDIAKIADVNPSTVSRALKDHPDISAVVKEKIKAVADELGYFPNIQAARFREGRSSLIGVILPQIADYFFPSVIRSIESTFHDFGYSLIICQTNNSLEEEKNAVRFCLGIGVDGMLVSASIETQNDEHLQLAKRNGTHVVMFDKIAPNSNLPSVAIDDVAVTFQAVQHLIDKGYRRISGLFGNENLEITRHRKLGFQNALSKAQLEVPESFYLHAGSTQEGKDVVRKMFQSSSPPRALFVMSDELLAGAIEVLHELLFPIPQRLAIISISDGFLPYALYPKISHIKHSGKDIGQASAKLLVQLLKGTNIEQQQITTPTQLVVLEST